MLFNVWGAPPFSLSAGCVGETRSPIILIRVAVCVLTLLNLVVGVCLGGVVGSQPANSTGDRTGTTTTMMMMDKESQLGVRQPPTPKQKGSSRLASGRERGRKG